MAIKAQAIKVRTTDLIEKIREAKVRDAERHAQQLGKVRAARLEKMRECLDQAKKYEQMSDEEYAASDYRF